MTRHHRPIRGRGTREAPPNRFESQALEIDLQALHDARIVHDEGEEEPDPRTRYLVDQSRSALSKNNSPDVPFDVGINPYRGCEHACPYCYARPGHEYLGLNAGLDFETTILVKPKLPDLLRSALSAPRWQPQVIAMSGVTDCYQPIERKLGITRRCLEVLAEFRNPVSIITKSSAVRRDVDVLSQLAAHDAASVTLSITSLDPDLARKLEPRAAQPSARLAAVRALADAGIPVGVNLAPIIPGLNEHEIPAILEAARDAGAQWAGWIMLRLPWGVKEIFSGWLEDHYPERRGRVLSRVLEVRGGRMNDPRHGSRMKGEGLYAEQVRNVFLLARRRAGFAERDRPLSTAAFRRPGGAQLPLL